jgi:sialate O-acetylesterase
MKLIFRYALVFGLLITVIQASAQIKLATIFSDHMILQREQIVPVWGLAAPGEEVRLRFNGENYLTTARADSSWHVELSATGAGGPYQMTVSGKCNSISVQDILLGDVYLCSGQSNMEFTMEMAKSKYPKEIQASANSNIRQFLVDRRYAFIPARNILTDGGWQAANPKSVLWFTAAGYFFAKTLYEKNKVPIGLIQATWGGTPIEAWMSKTALHHFPQYLHIADSIGMHQIEIQKHDLAMVAHWYQKLDSLENLSKASKNEMWLPVTMPGTWAAQSKINGNSGVGWLKKEIEIPTGLVGKDAQLILSTILDEDTTYVNGVRVGSTSSRYLDRKYMVPGQLIHAGKNEIRIHVISNYGAGGLMPDKSYALIVGGEVFDLAGAWEFREIASLSPMVKTTGFPGVPTGLFGGMLSPLVPYGIKGVLWYQGEANVTRAYEYANLFKYFITDLRQRWGQPRLPFLFVQLANFSVGHEPFESTWAELREAQLSALSLPITAMAVTIDLGESRNIHYLNKADVGKRLALAAEKVIYGESLVYSGPVYRRMKIAGKQVIIDFDHTGSGLVTRDGKDLGGIAIAGENQKFVWAKARIEGVHLIVWSEHVPRPVAVRYAWADDPDGCNLINKEGLPASPFRTDHWAGITSKNKK